MVEVVDCDALRDRAGKLGGPHLNAFGHAFCLFERHHQRCGQEEELVKRVLLQVAEVEVEVVVDVHCRKHGGKRQGPQSGIVYKMQRERRLEWHYKVCAPLRCPALKPYIKIKG